MEKNSLVTGKIGPTLLRFALPFLLASLLQALYGAADLFVVGQFADSAAVSAVAVGSQVMQTITGIILGLSMGGTVLIGRCVGEGDDRETAGAVGTLSVLLVLLAAVLTPAMLLCTDGAVSLMQTPAQVAADARSYIFACSCGIPFILGYNAVSAIFRGLGDSRTPVYFIALACAVNVGADFLLVGGLHMGALGAALATVLAQGLSFLTALLYLRRRGFSFPLCRRDFRLNPRLAGFILRVGLPLALQDALVNVSFLLITAIINTMGLIASAALGVVEKLIGFAMLPPTAFSSAVATMTSQNMGAGLPRRASAALRCGILFSLAFGAAVCLYCQFLPQTLTSLFTRDPQVVLAASQYLRSFSLDCVLVSFVFCFNSYFSGLGKSVVAMAHSLFATFCVRIPLSYFFSFHSADTLYPMGLAAPAASLVSIAVCTAYFLWRRRREPLR